MNCGFLRFAFPRVVQQIHQTGSIRGNLSRAPILVGFATAANEVRIGFARAASIVATHLVHHLTDDLIQLLTVSCLVKPNAQNLFRLVEQKRSFVLQLDVFGDRLDQVISRQSVQDQETVTGLAFSFVNK